MTTTIDPDALESIASLLRPGKPDLSARVILLFKTESFKALEAIDGGLDELFHDCCLELGDYPAKAA